MASLNLPICLFLGPSEPSSRMDAPALPPDYASEPFRYLPPRIVLSDAELDLARRYEQGDFSGGYGTSQIAHFRRGPSREQHEARREKLHRLHPQVQELGLALPGTFIQLMQSDDYMARLRHNTIWLTLPHDIVPLPSHPEYKLFLMGYEGQGCGFWHLLLGPDGSHVIAFSEHSFGFRHMYSGGHEPNTAAIPIYQCASSFEEWIVRYFADCVAGDRHYERLLAQWPPGM